MSKFKVGDRVIYVGENLKMRGLAGTVAHLPGVTWGGIPHDYLVTWDGKHDLVAVVEADLKAVPHTPIWQKPISEKPRLPHNHYYKDVSTYDYIDVYRILRLFEVADPCIQHAVKKLLVAGGRGAGKDWKKDIREAIDSLQRALEMEQEDEKHG